MKIYLVTIIFHACIDIDLLDSAGIFTRRHDHSPHPLSQHVEGLFSKSVLSLCGYELFFLWHLHPSSVCKKTCIIQSCLLSVDIIIISILILFAGWLFILTSRPLLRNCWKLLNRHHPVFFKAADAWLRKFMRLSNARLAMAT